MTAVPELETAVLEGLRDPAAYPHPAAPVEVRETHISWIFLAGEYAYKVKRPVALGFVDFSTLQRRRFYCEEELRLNRRLAPQLYLAVVPVRQGPAGLRVDAGAGEIVDYAVRMRRFPDDALLRDRPLDAELIDRLAERIARFHAGLPPAPPDSPYGEPHAVLAPMLENFPPIRDALGAEPADAMRIDRLERWIRRRFAALRPRLERRRRDGRIRECHGDMHRGNVAVLDGEPVIFDCIEFDPALRWIDTMSELAFLTMDLAQAGSPMLARRALNRYLEVSGDYHGLGVLRFYEVYRALVRAKVEAIGAGAGGAQRDRHLAELRRYLALARGCTARHRPRLFITHGLSGSGKTRVGHVLREHLPVVQLRSDIERKRLFGVPERARPQGHQLAQLYGAGASERTYERLAALAAEVIGAGFSALVDATFLRRAQRARFLALGDRLGCGCTILALQAPMHLLRERVAARQTRDDDASDADIDVLALQIAQREPLGDDERRAALLLDTEQPLQVDALLRRIAQGGPAAADG